MKFRYKISHGHIVNYGNNVNEAKVSKFMKAFTDNRDEYRLATFNKWQN